MANSVSISEWNVIDQRGSKIASKFRTWHGLKTGAMTGWQEVERYLYATDTSSTSNGTNTHGHSTHIPVTMEIKQDLEAVAFRTVFPHRDFFDFEGAASDPATVDKQRTAKNYLKTKHRLNKMSKVIKAAISDMCTYGTCFIEVYYEDNTELLEGKTKTGYVGPKARRISPYDIVFNPLATSFEESPKIIRTLMDIGTFITTYQDDDTANQDAIARVRRRRNTISGLRAHEKNTQYVPEGFGSVESYYESETVELLTFYGTIYDSSTDTVTKDRKIVVVDGLDALIDEPIDTPDGKPYIFQGRWEPRPDNLWPMGPLDNIIGIQYMINNRENGKSDILDKFITPDELHLGDVDVLWDEEEGKRIFLAPEGGGVQELRPDASALAFDGQIDRYRQQARSSARIPQELAGFRTPGEKTAFEVGNLSDGALRGFTHKMQDFEEDVLEPVLRAELELAIRNLGETGVDQVIEPVANTEATILRTISRSDLVVDGTIVPQGATRFARKNNQLNSLVQLSNTNLWAIAQPHVSGQAAARAIEHLGEFDEQEIFQAWAAVREQVEGQFEAQRIQQTLAATQGAPTLEGVSDDSEALAIEEQQTQ